MRSRPAQTPCLGERVTALADGSLRPDVRDRALAHTLTCPSCRDALDVERLTLERLRSLAGPEPSGRLLAELLALGGPGGPVPPRRRPGPGMARPAPVPVRPGGSSRPGPGSPLLRRPRRRLVAAAAAALGVGVIAAGVLTAASTTITPASVPPPTVQLTVQQPTSPMQQGFSTARIAPVNAPTARLGPAPAR